MNSINNEDFSNRTRPEGGGRQEPGLMNPAASAKAVGVAYLEKPAWASVGRAAQQRSWFIKAAPGAGRPLRLMLQGGNSAVKGRTFQNKRHLHLVAWSCCASHLNVRLSD